MSRLVVSVHDPPVWTIPDAHVRRIAEALPDVEVIDARTPEERAAAFPSADVLLATKLSSGEARLLSRTRWIQSTAVGVSTLLVPELIDSPIILTNVRGVHGEIIAEHAIALVLALRRRIHTAVRRQIEGEWAQTELLDMRLPLLRASHLVVVGLGGIGAPVAALAAGLGMRVTGIRRRLDLPVPAGVSAVLGPDQLREVLPDADALVLTVPRTTETRAMIGAEELAAMKPTSVLVNVSRGRLVDDEALVAALEQGQIAGAGLDAFVREPLPSDHRFWHLPNVLMTPHVAAFGEDYWTAAVDFFLDNFARYRRGEPLLNVVNKTLGY
jgi:phosphoglycerate dehydrogenase-like enzyme